MGLQPFPVLVYGLPPRVDERLHPGVPLLYVGEEYGLPFLVDLVLGLEHDRLGLRDCQDLLDLLGVVPLLLLDVGHPYEVRYYRRPTLGHRYHGIALARVGVNPVDEERPEHVVVLLALLEVVQHLPVLPLVVLEELVVGHRLRGRREAGLYVSLDLLLFSYDPPVHLGI